MKIASDPASASKSSWGEVSRPKALSPPASESEHGHSLLDEDATPAPQEVLRRNDLKRRALLSSISDLVFTVRKDGTVVECHVPRDTAFTLSADGLLGKRLMELLPIQMAQQAMHYLEKALRTGQRQVFACPFPVSGQVRDFETRITSSGPAEAIAVVRDVTAHQASEKEILDISNRAQERLGQDLHDGLGQHLTGITFLTKALERKLAARSLPEAEEAADIGRLVLQALSQTRNLARGLFPVELESNGLIPAFRELAATVEKFFAITCLLECDENLVIADRMVANHLFRLAQEAINNSVKHGKAKQVVISLKAVENSVVLSIRDNGTGFPQESTSTRGLGLRIMNFRAQKVGASLDIRPGEACGTVVSCTLLNHLRKVEFGRK